MANNDASQIEERLVDIRPSFVTNPETAKLMEPTDCPFHNPASPSQAASVLGLPPSKHRFDPEPLQKTSMRLGIVSAISLKSLWGLSWASWFSADRRDGSHERKDLSDVVLIGRSRSCGQGNSLSIRQDMVFAARLAAIRGVRAGIGPPKTARTEEESMMARDQSILSASRSRSRSN